MTEYGLGTADQGGRESGHVDTPLLALLSIAASRGVDMSEALIRRDHALPEGPTSFELLVKIAERHGLRARAVPLGWGDLAKLKKALPVALRMSNGQAMILVGFRPRGPVPVALLRDPADPGQTVFAIDEVRLTDAWNGEALLIKKRHGANDVEQPFGIGWMARQALKDIRLFRDIGIAAFFMSLFALMPLFLFIVVIDRVLTYQRESTLFVMAGAVAFMLLFDTMFGYVRRYLVAITSARLDARLNVYVFNKLIGLPIDFFERRTTGEITHRIHQAWKIKNFLTGQLFGTVLDSMVLVFILPVMFWLSSFLTIIALGVGTLMCIVVIMYLAPLGRAYERVTLAETRKGSFLIENIHGIRTIKSLALEESCRMEWDARVAEATRAHTGFELLANQPQTILQPMEKLLYAGVLLIGAYLAIDENSTMHVGALLAITLMSQRVAAPFVQIAQLMQQYEEVRGAFAMVAEVVNHEPEQPPGRQGVRPVILGAIEFSGVRFRYAGSEAYALDDLTFSIPKGKVIGIMGRSGSGKTTVTRLLQGLHRTYEGLVKVDGVDLREIDLAHLRSHVGVVLQDNFLFHGTIRENIMAANRSASLEDVIRVSRLAGAEEFIDRLPMGYETMIEEGSANLSGGQRQRIAIARALLVNPKVLLLDEATSALDPDSEAIVNNNLLRIAAGRTVIVISHRLSSLVSCDSIMVMERGKLVDMGRHRELLRRCEIYSHLWNQQNRNIQIA